MAKYRKKPVVIEAEAIKERVVIHTGSGAVIGRPGDYLITGTMGEKYPCKPETFHGIYELVEE